MTTPPTKRFFIWDTYWEDGWLHSYDLDSPACLAALDSHWAELTNLIPAGSAILDVGCGNGAASLGLARAARAVSRDNPITAIDQSAIDPPRTVKNFAEDLSKIKFMSRTEMEALPFADATFDAVVSQYGVEFGNTPKALAEIARVLKPNAILSILGLPAQSHVLHGAKKSFRQARYLLTDSNLFDTALKVIREYHQMPQEEGEQKMRDELGKFCRNVEHAFSQFNESEVAVLSAIVTVIYDVFTKRKTSTSDEQLMTLEFARTRLAHYAARLQATMKAAIADSNFTGLRPMLAAANLRIIETGTLLVTGRGILAYRLTAQRAPA